MLIDWKIKANYQNGMNDRTKKQKMDQRAVKAAEMKNPYATAYIAGYNGTPYMNVKEGATK
jgi:hypothetical protein